VVASGILEDVADEKVPRKPPRNLARAFRLLTGLSADFFKGGRKQPKPPKRAGL